MEHTLLSQAITVAGTILVCPLAWAGFIAALAANREG